MGGKEMQSARPPRPKVPELSCPPTGNGQPLRTERIGLIAHPPIASSTGLLLLPRIASRVQRAVGKPHMRKGRGWRRSNKAPTLTSGYRCSANMRRRWRRYSRLRNIPCCRTCTWSRYRRLAPEGRGPCPAAGWLARSCTTCFRSISYPRIAP